MKRVVLVLVIFTAIAILWLLDPGLTENGATTSERSPLISGQANAKNSIKINVPKSGRRVPATDLSTGDTHKFLNLWWKNIPGNQRKLYSMKLLEQNQTRETYQVYLKGRPIDSLVVHRKLKQAQGVEAFPNFEIVSDNNLIGVDAAKAKVLSSDTNIANVGQVEQVWEIMPSRILSPAYKVSVQLKGEYGTQTWLVNAKTGDVSSINTHSRR